MDDGGLHFGFYGVSEHQFFFRQLNEDKKANFPVVVFAME